MRIPVVRTPVVSNVFRRMVSAAQIEHAALDIIKEWIPDYLEEYENAMGWRKGTLPIPENYMNRNSFDIDAGEDIPKVIAISPGLQGQPIMSGGNQYRAIWQLGIGVAHAHEDEEVANEMIKAYGTVIHKLLTDKQTLGGFPGIAQIDWVGETFDDLNIPNQLKLFMGASEFFTVDVDNVMTARHGPKTHNQQSYGQVQEVFIDLVKEPIDGS